MCDLHEVLPIDSCLDYDQPSTQVMNLTSQELFDRNDTVEFEALLRKGDIIKANQLLGIPYRFEGKLGPFIKSFPAEQLIYCTLDTTSLVAVLPKEGVYQVNVVLQGKRFDASMRIANKSAQKRVELIVDQFASHMIDQEIEVIFKNEPLHNNDQKFKELLLESPSS